MAVWVLNHLKPTQPQKTQQRNILQDQISCQDIALLSNILFRTILKLHYNKKEPIRALLLWCGPGGIRTPEGVSQQIYSLPRLTASVPTHFLLLRVKSSHLSDSNRRPAVYKTDALPAELRWPLKILTFKLINPLSESR